VDTTILGLNEERAKEMPYIASMGIYVFSKNAMLQLLRDKFPDANDFGSEVIPGATNVGMRVFYFYSFQDFSIFMGFNLSNRTIYQIVPTFNFL
jgi:glucose-1-phosphate adenylyltransferase